MTTTQLLSTMAPLLGLAAEANSSLRAGLTNYLSQALPGEAGQLVTRTLNQISSQASGGTPSIWPRGSTVTATRARGLRVC